MNRKGFVAFINGEPQIALGCFLGAKKPAVAAIREKYGKDSNYEAVVVAAFAEFSTKAAI